MDHLGETEVLGFWQASLTPAARLRILRHLLSGCFSCRERLRAAAPESLSTAESVHLALYEDSFARAEGEARRLAARLGEDAQQVEGLLERLRRRGSGTLEQPADEDRWVGVEAALQRAFELRYADPAAMLELARWAQAEADTLAPNAYGEGFLFDLRARAWADLANACRINERFGEADAALVESRRRAVRGSGDLQLSAYIDEIEAALRRAQRRLEEALRLLHKAQRAYLLLGDQQLAGRTLVSRSYCLGLLKRPAESVKALRQALAHLDFDQDPRLFTVAQQNLLDALVEAGRLTEAGRFLLESGLRQKLAGDPLNLLRLRWVEAKLLAARERLASAERALAEVRAGFHARGLAYDEALSGLDLAGVLLRQGRQDRVHVLARELYTLFAERNIHPEAINALMIFEVACGQRRATVHLVLKVRRVLSEIQAHPTASRSAYA